MSESPTPQVTTDDLLDVLTLGEIAQVEELAGISISAMSDPTQRKAPLLIAMACVAGRRAIRPDYTLNEAEAITGQGLNDLIEKIVRPAGAVPPPPPAEPEVLATAIVGGSSTDPEG